MELLKNTIKNKKSRLRKKDKMYLQKLLIINPNLRNLINKFELVQIKSLEQ